MTTHTEPDTQKPMRKQIRFKKRDGIFLLLGIFAAFLLRFAFVNSVKTHYHANFALYVNGVRDEFKSPTFYEEIASCTDTNHDDPKSRTHMHGQEFDTIHVHDNGVTWSHFFANISYALGDKVLVTDAGVFVDGADGKYLTFTLNGKQVSSIANVVIGSEDKLLVDYSSDDSTTLTSRYATIASTAQEHNEKPDPSSCSGSESESLKARLTRTLGIDSVNNSHSQSSHSH